MSANNHNPNDPYALPDFDEWGWDDYWSQQDWRTWYVALANEFGKPEAGDRFVQAWNSRTGFFESFGDVRADWVALDTEFREWAENEPTSAGMNVLEAIQKSVILGDIFGEGSEIVTGTVNNASDAVNNATGAAVNTTKTLKWLLPVLMVLAGAMILYIIYSKSKFKLT
jgi:hypothetical protein